MADLELLKRMREAGVKSASFDGEDLTHVEFYPRSALDLSAFAADETDPLETPTERPPAPEADEQPIKIAPAFARVLGNRSVS